MSVKLIGTASGQELEVDATPKAARVILYDAAGNALLRNSSFGGIAEIEVRQSAATAAAAVVWGLHNPHATVKIYVKRIEVRCFFDGAAAATLMKYELIKATSVSAFSAGAAVTPLTKKTGQTAVGVVRVLDTGLTTAGIANVQVLGNIAMGRVTQTTTNFQSSQLQFDFASLLIDEIQLVQNEILAIRQTLTSVIGDNIVGSVDWSET